ncbi:hypothetical protein GQ457_03G016000 [Hibiscus cannabinus]
MENTISLRSLLEKEKLNDINFLDWFHNLRIVLKHESVELEFTTEMLLAKWWRRLKISYSGSARSKLGSSELDSGSGSARDLNKPSRANSSSARKAPEPAEPEPSMASFELEPSPIELFPSRA